MRDGVRRITHITEVMGMEGEVVTTQDLFTYEFKGESPDGKLRRRLQELRPAPALPAARRLLRPRQGADGGDGMSSAGLDLGTVTMLIACGAGLTFLALCVVFGGFFAERRLRDRLEDIETRARTGSRTLQMATLRRVEKAGPAAHARQAPVALAFPTPARSARSCSRPART